MRGRRGIPRCVTVMVLKVEAEQLGASCLWRTCPPCARRATVALPRWLQHRRPLVAQSTELRFALRVKLPLLPSEVCLRRTAGPGPFSIHTIPSLLTVYGEI